METIQLLERYAPARALLNTTGKGSVLFGAALGSYFKETISFESPIVLELESIDELIRIFQCYRDEKNSIFDEQISSVLIALSLSNLHAKNDLSTELMVQQKIQDIVFEVLYLKSTDMLQFLDSKLDSHLVPFEYFVGRTKETKFEAIDEYITKQLSINNFHNTLAATIYLSQHDLSATPRYFDSCIKHAMSILEMMEGASNIHQTHQQLLSNSLCGFVMCISSHPFDQDNTMNLDYCSQFITDLYAHGHSFNLDSRSLLTYLNCCFDALFKLNVVGIEHSVVEMLVNSLDIPIYSDFVIEAHLAHIQKSCNADNDLESKIIFDLLIKIQENEGIFSLIKYVTLFNSLNVSCKRIAVELAENNINNENNSLVSLNILLFCSKDDLFTYKFTNVLERYLFSIEFDHFQPSLLVAPFKSFLSEHSSIFQALFQRALKESLDYFEPHPSVNAKRLVVDKFPFFLSLIDGHFNVSLDELEVYIVRCWFFIISFGFDLKQPYQVHSDLEPLVKSLSHFISIPFSSQFFHDEIHVLYERHQSKAPSIKSLNAQLVHFGIVEGKEGQKDIGIIYQNLIIYHSLRWQLQEKHDTASFFHILKTVAPKISVFKAAIQSIKHGIQGFYCDEMMHFINQFFVELLKKSTSRFTGIANASYECSFFLMKKFTCCLRQNPSNLEFLMGLLSKLHEASTLEWNETFDPTVTTSQNHQVTLTAHSQQSNVASFKIDVIDNLEVRVLLYKRMEELFFSYISKNSSDFCLLSHVYLILRDHSENISSHVKKITLERLLLSTPTRKTVPVSLRNVHDDLSFVIKMLSFSLPISTGPIEMGVENNSFNYLNNSFISESLLGESSVNSTINESLIESSLNTGGNNEFSITNEFEIICNFRNSFATDPTISYVHSFIKNAHFKNSLSISILTGQLICYASSVLPSLFPDLLQSFLDSFFKMKSVESGIFSCPSNEYLFNGKIIAGPSNVDHFKACFVSPSLPFIVLLDAIQEGIERLAFKNEKIRLLSQNICNFFCSSASSLSNNPLYLPALFKIASLMLNLNSLFDLELIPFIEKFIVSCYDCEVVDCRFSDAKSWSLEKETITHLIEQSGCFGEKARRLIKFLLKFDLYRQSLWHNSTCDYQPFPMEWDFKSCKDMIGICFSEYGLPRLGMNLYLKIHMALNKVPQPTDLLNVLVANANTCPISIKCPFLLIRMIESKLMNESLIKLIDDWATLSPITLIGLLREEDSLIRKYSIECLKYGYTPQVIFFYIPQLVQLLRKDSCLGNTKEIIFELAQKSRLFSHLNIWNMRANLATDDAGEKPDPLLAPILNDCIEKIKSEFSTEDREFYEREFGFFEKITNISGLLKPFIKCNKVEKKNKIDQELAKIPVDSGVYLPSNPESTVIGIDYHSGRPLQSAAKAPFMATFEIQQQDQLVPIRQSAIFKVGDDCRQDVLALQMINMFKMIFDSVGLPLYLYPYRVVATAPGCGVIEVIPEAMSRDTMGREYVNDLYEYYLQKFGSEESFEFQQARQRFICSLAAYSVVSFLLSFKDRHNGNIMFDSMGHIIHIDFGFMLGISPGNANIEGEGFKLTGEMLRLMGGTEAESEHFIRFKTLVVNGYIAVRPWMDEFVRVAELMAESGLPCMRRDTIEKFRMKFRPDLSEFQARKFMLQVIDKSSEYIFATLYDLYQFKKHKIPYKK